MTAGTSFGLRPSLRLSRRVVPKIERHEVQGIFVHGALLPELGPIAGAFSLGGERRGRALPGEGEDHALVGAGGLFEPLLEEPGDGALGTADRTVQKQDAFLGAVALGGGFEGVHQVVKLAIEAVDGVAVQGGKFGEELVACHLFLLFVALLGAVRQDHVVQPLVGGAGHFGVFADDVQVLLESALPVLLAIIGQIELLPQSGQDIFAGGHVRFPPGRNSVQKFGAGESAKRKGRRW